MRAFCRQDQSAVLSKRAVRQSTPSRIGEILIHVSMDATTLRISEARFHDPYTARKAMSEHTSTNGCEWWRNGKTTANPPEDELFLRLLTQSGFLAFTGPGGLAGARCGSRDVIAIHCGQGKRWHLSFVEDNADQFDAHVTDLPSKVAVATQWLNGGLLGSIRAAITKNEW